MHSKRANLFELMNSKDASSIASVRSDLLPEARRQSCVLDGQGGFGDPLLTMEGGDRLLRRGDQVLFVDGFVVRFFTSFSGDLCDTKYKCVSLRKVWTKSLKLIKWRFKNQVSQLGEVGQRQRHWGRESENLQKCLTPFVNGPLGAIHKLWNVVGKGEKRLASNNRIMSKNGGLFKIWINKDK